MSNTAAVGPAIELSGMTKSFRRERAVDGLTLSIPRGSTFGFIGPNGAGKTTTIRMLMGLLPMDAGRATVLGMDVAAQHERIRRRVGYVPERHFIYRGMRVGEVIRFCRALYETWSDETCDELRDLFELPLDRRVKALSKGMLAKLALLLALAHQPQLLILDEPTAGLDPLIREEFLEGILRALVGGGRTVIFSSHTLADVERLADTAGIICEGRLLVHCPLDELTARTKRVRLALAGGEPPAELLARGLCHRMHRNECLLTVGGFSADTPDELAGIDGVRVVEVLDVTLEEAFKDYIRGRRNHA